MAVKSAGALSPDIQAQVNARMASIDGAGAAASVKAGVVKDKGIVQEKLREKEQIAKLPKGQKVERPDSEPPQRIIRRERGSELRSSKEAGDAFVEAATKAIEADDARAVDTTPRNRSYRRGALIDQKDEPAETDVGQEEDAAPESTGAPREIDEAAQENVPEISDKTNSDEMTHEKALKLLRLDGFKTKAIEKLTPEEAIELATHRASVRSGVEERLRKLAEYEKNGSSVTEKEKAPDAGTATPATTGKTFDLKAATTKFRETYGDELSAMTLEEPLGAVLKYVEEMVEARVKSVSPYLERMLQMDVRYSRDQLARVYPELDKDEVFSRVQSRAQKLDIKAYGGDIHAMLSDAARLELGSAKKAEEREAARDARRRAQPPTSSRRGPDAKPKSRLDLMGDIATAIEDGDGEEVDRLRRALA